MAALPTGDRARLVALAAGQARLEADAARADLQSAKYAAEHGQTWRERHSARRALPGLAQAASEAQRHWDALVGPELARLDHEVAKAEVTVQQLAAAVERSRTTSGEPDPRPSL
ncbi:MAG TPA: hypothetical protein VME46_05955 [Acidimicrobiales bacterium]|nr:hypothetical protein [Acidimicrobiales bacterium]